MASLTSGSRLGPYEILQLDGAGGMGEVYRARDTRLDRDVAIKVLPEHMATDKRALSRFEREAKAVAALSHPNILAIYDIGTVEDVNYVVTELLEGETLRTRLNRSPLLWRNAIETCIAIAEGLDAAHAKGIIHRDLKPENIFLTNDGRVKILDFGLATFQSIRDFDETAGGRTEAGAVLGTAAYMSPEQIRSEQVTPCSDIFSLGCVLYEMIAGRRAFGRPTAAESMAAILKEEPPGFDDSSGHLPVGLERLVRHCLQKTTQVRFRSARDLIFALEFLDRPLEQAQAEVDSIAVLPFSSASGSETEYLSDGITESLINNFSAIGQLRVVPRSVAFRYKGSDVDPQIIGRELNVRVLLSGKVLQRGDRLMVQAELVDTLERKQVWGERFNRSVSDIFEVEEQIAKQISDQLRTKLTGKDKRLLTRRFTENTLAYQSYLKGRYYWSRRTPDSLTRSIEYFQQATDEDPLYALAYAGLADSYIVLGWYGFSTPAEAVERSRRSALKAVEIDSELAEGHAALGFAKGCGGDWAGADAAFQRAFQQNPGYWLAYDWYAICLSGRGRFEEAIEAIQTAKKLDPLSLVIHQHAAWVYIHARRYDTAIEECRKALEIDPNYPLGHFWMGVALTQKSMHEQAMTTLEKARGFVDIPFAAAALAHAYAASGRRNDAETLLQELTTSHEQNFVDPYHLAVVHAALGEPDRVFDLLELAYQDQSIWLTCWLKGDPRLDPVRSDPRFSDLLRRIGSKFPK
jgi:serine/threonine-protein kinase